MALAALPGCRTPRSIVQLNAADTHPAGYPTVEALRHMAKQLAARTEGRLRIKTFPGSILGQERDTLEITIFGGIDLNRVSLAPLNSIVPETLVPTLPFVFRSTAHMRATMDGAPGEKILKAMEPYGLIGLCFYDSGARSFYTTDRPITVPTDMRGLKIRVQSSDMFVAMVDALGANATPMDFGEVYQGLLQGTVDGAENNWPSYESTRHFEAAKYYSLTEHVMSPEVLVMSARRWAMLQTADQKLLRDCARDSVAVMRKLWDQRVDRARAAVLESGVVVTTPEREAFRDRVRPVWDRFLSTAPLRKLAEEIDAISEDS
jgi:tripartite ATP-independent transporter DctP family solute receptor